MGDTDLISQQEARDAVEAASVPSRLWRTFDQARSTRSAKRWRTPRLPIAAAVWMANEETGFGKAEDKREKNRFAAEDVWNYFNRPENCRRSFR